MGTVFDIQRFSVHDGPGIRTTVFLKGCPLNCIWCHNPESKSPAPQMLLHTKHCIGCGECISACDLGLHSFDEESNHHIQRENCIFCRKCEAVCTGAIEICGKEMSADEVIDTVMRDFSFYKNSGGGMTLSGGEPLMQADFSLRLLMLAKEKGLNTAMETSGMAKWESIQSVIPYTDLFLWDYKETCPERHKQYTGATNALILENLRRLNDSGGRIVLRCPIIPGYNDREDHFQAVGKLAEELEGVIRVDIEPYHPLGKSKAEALGKDYPLGDLSFPEKETVMEWVAAVSRHTSKPVVKS
ncbi:MAG: glycyl-radical enzyme activating protein [Ruminococcaceae bacterium]|nr:glycyl-radical enzyme activating protein [Oscillospiraceae bacterium]